MLLLVASPGPKILEAEWLAEQRSGCRSRYRGRRRCTFFRAQLGRGETSREAWPICNRKSVEALVNVLACWRYQERVGTTTTGDLLAVHLQPEAARIATSSCLKSDSPADCRLFLGRAGAEPLRHDIDRSLLFVGLLIVTSRAELVIGSVLWRYNRGASAHLPLAAPLSGALAISLDALLHARRAGPAIRRPAAETVVSFGACFLSDP